MKTNKWSPDEVKRWIDGGQEIVFLDTRSPEAWDKSSVKISNALRMPVDEITARLTEIPQETTIVTYCT